MNSYILKSFNDELLKLSEKKSWSEASKNFQSSSDKYKDLNSAVKYRSSLKKGSDEYLAVQNDINKSFGKTNRSANYYKSLKSPTSDNTFPASGSLPKKEVIPVSPTTVSRKYTKDSKLQDFDPKKLSKIMARMEGYNVDGSLAQRNFNPGNLKFAKQPGAILGEKGFAKFPSEEAGYTALENQIKLDASPKRKHTITSFLHKYAPKSDNNDTDNYLDFILNRSNAA